jgi:hypothetical protein
MPTCVRLKFTLKYYYTSSPVVGKLPKIWTDTSETKFCQGEQTLMLKTNTAIWIQMHNTIVQMLQKIVDFSMK